MNIMVMAIVGIIISYYITWNAMLDNYTGINHLNRFYHGILMAFLMAGVEAIMLLTMDFSNVTMYIVILSTLIGSIIFWILIRKQTGINEKEFYKGMIQHHEAAIFMAKRVLKRKDISDKLRVLANNIIMTQTKEIQDMQD